MIPAYLGGTFITTVLRHTIMVGLVRLSLTTFRLMVKIVRSRVHYKEQLVKERTEDKSASGVTQETLIRDPSWAVINDVLKA